MIACQAAGVAWGGDADGSKPIFEPSALPIPLARQNRLGPFRIASPRGFRPSVAARRKNS